MSASPLMSIGARALFANLAALQTTGHNIANANVEGYSRQQTELQTSQGQFTGAGFFGKGVDVASVTRAHNAFLTREAAATRALASADSARAEQLARLEAVFPPGEAGLGFAAASLLDTMVDLASQPADASTREVVLARAQDFAQRFAAAGAQLQSLDASVTSDLQVQVARVNTLAGSIAQVNDRIARVQGLGQPPNDLLDQRDQLIAELSTLVPVTTVAAGDGSVGVFVAGGQRLVLGNQVAPLALVADPFDPQRSTLGVIEQGQPRVLAALGGGSIGGLLRFQQDDLADARNQLGRMAASLATTLNTQQSLGLDLRSPPGAGAALFAIGAPQALPHAGNAKNAGGAFIGSVAMSVADPAALQASDYTLEADAALPGQYRLTRERDGLVRSIANGATVDGVTFTVAADQPGDRFLLRPVAQAAVNLRRVLDLPAGLAAASPLQAVRESANTGSASIGSFAVVDPAVDPERSASIVFTSAAGAYDWQLRDRSTNALLASGSGTVAPGGAIALNGFELRLDGVPAAGDRFSVGRTTHPGASNGNALAFAALRDAALVGGATPTDAYASLMAGIGVKVQSAQTASEISQASAAQVRGQLEAQTGVNLDEEAARLIQFQQSYQAAAKVLQVAQTIFDTLLQTTGR